MRVFYTIRYDKINNMQCIETILHYSVKTTQGEHFKMKQ